MAVMFFLQAKTNAPQVEDRPPYVELPRATLIGLLPKQAAWAVLYSAQAQTVETEAQIVVASSNAWFSLFGKENLKEHNRHHINLTLLEINELPVINEIFIATDNSALIVLLSHKAGAIHWRGWALALGQQFQRTILGHSAWWEVLSIQCEGGPSCGRIASSTVVSIVGLRPTTSSNQPKSIACSVHVADTPFFSGLAVTKHESDRSLQLHNFNLKAKTEIDISQNSSLPSLSETFPTWDECNRWAAAITEKVGGSKEIASKMLHELNLLWQLELSTDAPAHIGAAGIILHGLPGVGKSALMRALRETAPASVLIHVINAPDFFRKNQGEGEQELRAAFSFASMSQHTSFNRTKASLLIIEELDVLADRHFRLQNDQNPIENDDNDRINDFGLNNYDESAFTSLPSGADTERRLQAELLHLLDQGRSRGLVIVGLTNRIEAIDDRFRRPHRFSQLIEMTCRTTHDRWEVLRCLTKVSNQEEPIINDSAALNLIAASTHGFVGADLLQLLRTAVNCASRAGSAKLTLEHFMNALASVRPANVSSMNARTTVSSDVSMLAGLEGPTQQLSSILVTPYIQQQDQNKLIDVSLASLGVAVPRGVLIVGPSGCGKTRLALQVAQSSPLPIIVADGTQLRSKVVGESERAVQDLFARARLSAPCILLLDPLDSIAPMRTSNADVSSRLTAALLTEMDGVFHNRARTEELLNIVIVGVTNDVKRVDSAILRPGRLDQRIHINAPNALARKSIFKTYLSRTNTTIFEDNKLLENLSEATQGYTGADIEATCYEAGMNCFRQFIQQGSTGSMDLQPEHIWQALTVVRPSLQV